MIEDMIIKRDKREEDMREVFAEAPKKKKSRWKTATGITLVLVCLVAGVIYACGTVSYTHLSVLLLFQWFHLHKTFSFPPLSC